jgi:hypothetical protein
MSAKQKVAVVNAATSAIFELLMAVRTKSAAECFEHVESAIGILKEAIGL